MIFDAGLPLFTGFGNVPIPVSHGGRKQSFNLVPGNQ